MIIPKTHGEKLIDIPDDELAEAMPVAKKIAQAIGADNYNILQNNGRLAHQEVDHVCWHQVFQSLGNTISPNSMKYKLTNTGPFPCDTKTRPRAGSRDKLASTEDRYGCTEVTACGSEEQDVKIEYEKLMAARAGNHHAV